MRHASLVLGALRHVLLYSPESNAARNKLALGLWPAIELWLSRLQLNQTPVVQPANSYYLTPDSGRYQPGIT